MKRQKSFVDLVLETRRTWSLNPVTRVHDSNNKKGIKKQRMQGKKSCRDHYNSSLQDFLFAKIRISMV